MKKFTLNLLALLAALASSGAFAQLTLPATSTPRPPGAPTLPPGLYVAVLDGAINLSNKGGTSTFAAGQFGYLPSSAGVGAPPAILPRAPTLLFTPPAAFMGPSAGGRAPIDCVVR